MLVRFFPVVCATALLLPVPAAASDVAEGSPITVERCTVSGQSVMENPKIGIRMPQVDGVRIVYTNSGSAAATQIRFRVKYQGATAMVVDRGSISPGQKISREFTGLNAIYGIETADCSVVEATFADGTHWTQPVANGAPANR